MVAGDQAPDLAARNTSARSGGVQSATREVADVITAWASDDSRVLHQRRLPDGSPIPLIVVAPSGVFVVDIVEWRGRVELSGGVVLVDQVARAAEIARAVEWARAVSTMLDSWTGADWTVPVYAVVCLAGDAQVGGWAATGGGHVVDIGWLTDFFDGLEPQLGPLHVEWASTALASRLPTAGPAASAAIRATGDSPAVPRPPAEPVVYLRRVTDSSGDRFVVLDEEGNRGGVIDLRSRRVAEAGPNAEPVLQQLLPHFVKDLPPGPSGGGWRRILPALRRRGLRILACMVWEGDGERRLYGFRLDDSGNCEDLGWIDPSTGRVAEVVAGAAEPLRYCADRFTQLDLG